MWIFWLTKSVEKRFYKYFKRLIYVHYKNNLKFSSKSFLGQDIELILGWSQKRLNEAIVLAVEKCKRSLN